MDLNFQYAHNSHDESETKSDVSGQDALRAFDEFDWNGQVEKANELQKCAPTLSVIHKNEIELAWVSVCGNKDNLEFVSECLFPGEVSSWFGLSKKTGAVCLHADSFSYRKARKVIELFAAKRYESLRSLYNSA